MSNPKENPRYSQGNDPLGVTLSTDTIHALYCVQEVKQFLNTLPPEKIPKYMMERLDEAEGLLKHLIADK